MDKWTRSFLDYGYSDDYLEVLSIIHDEKKLNKWARSRTDGMFGAVFGLSNAEAWLNFNPSIINDLSSNELNQYRRISATASMTNEIRIPVLFLLYRNWGFDSMKDYMDQFIKKGSSWSYFVEAWGSGMDAVNKIDLSALDSLDEPSKLLLYCASKDGGWLSTKEIPKQNLSSLKFFEKPTLDENVQYTLVDMKSTDLALFLKAHGMKQIGDKKERIKRILDNITIDEIAGMLNVTTESYLQISIQGLGKRFFSETTLFLYKICDAVYRLDFRYVHNQCQINQAISDGFGVKLAHHAKCPVHRKNSFKRHEIKDINPIAHPDCDAAIGYLT